MNFLVEEKVRFRNKLKVQSWREKKKNQNFVIKDHTISKDLEESEFSPKKRKQVFEEPSDMKKLKSTSIEDLNLISNNKDDLRIHNNFKETSFVVDEIVNNYFDGNFDVGFDYFTQENNYTSKEDSDKNYDQTSWEFIDIDSENSDNDCCSESSDDEEYGSDEQEEEEETVAEKLRTWAINHGIPHNQLDDLLKILRPVVPDLPLTSKTFLKLYGEYEFVIEKLVSTSKDSKIEAEFVYFGITEHLKKIVYAKNHDDFKLILQFFIDGLPLFKSSKIEFWPIVAKIKMKNNIYEPFIIACYCGEGKPFSAPLFFDKFIKELNHLLNHGIIIDEKKFQVSVMCLICDRPARAFAKGIIGHQGYYACERCQIKGLHFQNRRIYPSINNKLRTDKSFRDFEDPHHHTGYSPLVQIQSPKLDMVKQFPLDILHLGFLGLMKKMIIEYWLSVGVKLTKEEIYLINKRLEELASQIPCEFQRSTRSLGSVNLWKGTEFRMFCLYFGILVTQDILPKDLQENFIYLCVALRILHDPVLIKTHLSEAKNYLEEFVCKFGDLYGLQSLILNVHSLVHLTDDVEYFQCPLSDISAFLFESYLKKVKKSIRHGKLPLHQLCKRVAEQRSLLKKVIACKAKYTVKTTKSKIIKEVKSDLFSLKTKNPNNIVLLKNKNFFKIEKMYKKGKSITLQGVEIKKLRPAFDFPSSKIFEVLQIFEIDNNYEPISQEHTLEDVQRKAVVFKIFEGGSYVMPLLHE